MAKPLCWRQCGRHGRHGHSCGTRRRSVAPSEKGLQEVKPPVLKRWLSCLKRGVVPLSMAQSTSLPQTYLPHEQQAAHSPWKTPRVFQSTNRPYYFIGTGTLATFLVEATRWANVVVAEELFSLPPFCYHRFSLCEVAFFCTKRHSLRSKIEIAVSARCSGSHVWPSLVVVLLRWRR